MTEATDSQVLVVLTSSPAIESELIDWLLSREDEIGFTSCAVHGHSANYSHLSIAEQVIGRQRRQQIQVLLHESLLDNFLSSLVAELGDIDLHYWVIPVLAGGRLTRSG
jgi:hypothetical protein